MKRTTPETIRFIRESLGYSQSYMAEDIMTQSAYSKAERGEIELSFTKASLLMQKIDMSMDEFLYIKDGYSIPDDSGLQGLKKMDFTNEESLSQLKNKLKKIPSPSFRTLEYLDICEALLLIHSKNDYQLARKKVAPIWERLEKHDTWFLSDIYLINNILFLFPIETTILITEKILSQLKRYEKFRGIKVLTSNFQLNLSLLLLENQRYEDCLELLNTLILDFKRKRMYMHLALAYSRKGIVLCILEKKDYKKYFDLCFSILSFVDFQQLEKEIRKEINDYIEKHTTYSKRIHSSKN